MQFRERLGGRLLLALSCIQIALAAADGVVDVGQFLLGRLRGLLCLLQVTLGPVVRLAGVGYRLGCVLSFLPGVLQRLLGVGPRLRGLL